MVLSNSTKTVFLDGLLWELEVIQVKKTRYYDTFETPSRQTSQKTVFSTRSLKNNVNTSVLDEFVLDVAKTS